MSWTETEVKSWKVVNDTKLAEVNATLRPDAGKKTGKIGIFCHGQVGDLATAMSVLRYRREVFVDKQIVWFANAPNADLLRYAPISEVRPWPWAGNGLPEGCPDFWPMLCTGDNRLDLAKAKEFELTADIDDGYFPAPHQLSVQQRHGLDYPNCSRKVFGVGADKEWHPFLNWSFDEIREVEIFFQLRKNRKTIILEKIFCSRATPPVDFFKLKTN